MPKFRKKPVIIEAKQFTNNADTIIKWSKGVITKTKFPTVLIIETLEGDMQAHVGDWIIKGVKGEFYPCRPDIFKETYEPI